MCNFYRKKSSLGSLTFYFDTVTDVLLTSLFRSYLACCHFCNNRSNTPRSNKINYFQAMKIILVIPIGNTVQSKWKYHLKLYIFQQKKIWLPSNFVALTYCGPAFIWLRLLIAIIAFWMFWVFYCVFPHIVQDFYPCSNWHSRYCRFISKIIDRDITTISVYLVNSYFLILLFWKEQKDS